MLNEKCLMKARAAIIHDTLIIIHSKA